MAAEGGGEIREEGENWRWEWIGAASGSLSPALPVRGGGQAGAQVRGRAGERGGHLLLPTGRGGRRHELRWAGPGERQVTPFPFFCFCFCFANSLILYLFQLPNKL